MRLSRAPLAHAAVASGFSHDRCPSRVGMAGKQEQRESTAGTMVGGKSGPIRREVVRKAGIGEATMGGLGRKSNDPEIAANLWSPCESTVLMCRGRRVRALPVGRRGRAIDARAGPREWNHWLASEASVRSKAYRRPTALG